MQFVASESDSYRMPCYNLLQQRQNGGESGRFNSSSSHSFTATRDEEREDAWEEDRSWEERLRAEMDEDYVTPDWKSYDGLLLAN